MSTSCSARWRRVDALFHEALALPPDERRTFLEAECANDPPLFDEVLTLVLADAPGTAARYEDWAPHVASAWASDMSRSLAGETIGRYRVLERLGAGAMGVVYRAEDKALGRHIALKTLLPFAGDGARMRRLEQEARAASALNHPNILTIHEIGERDGVHFIAAELVEGSNLRDRLDQGTLSILEALDVAAQVAAGLGAAHAAAVIHRDIKPENLMVRRDGLVKIVDFGLAEAIEAAPTRRTPEGQDSGARSAAACGTLTYMSPEQALGEPLDARTDLFSLGVVLYEMATGTTPFERASESATLEALLHEPARRPSDVNPAIPSELDAVIARALEKRRELRYQTASLFEADLKQLRQSGGGSDDSKAPPAAEAGITEGSSRPRRSDVRRRIAVGTMLLVGVTSGLLGLSGMRRVEGLDPAGLASVRVTRQAGEELFPSLAPRGDTVVYASAAEGNWDIYLHRIGDNPVNLTAGSDVDDMQPVYRLMASGFSSAPSATAAACS